MTDEQQDTNLDHEPPPGATMTATWGDLEYTATSRWLVLRKADRPTAEIFSTSYVADPSDAERPVTFVFNGGPGAASAFLHVGAVGPRRVVIRPDGANDVPPPRLTHNDESWLAFTDLVLVDPVGTGFSRVIKPRGADAEKGTDGNDPNEYNTVQRDLESMCEFMGRWLSENHRWGSPVFIAGESYGGYRVGRLTRLAQEKGIALSGSILISPALEPAHLSIHFGWGDYEVVPWVDVLPTMAATAAHHGRSRAVAPGTPVEDVVREAEAFATGDYARFLTQGAAMPAEERERVIQRQADLIGLDPALVARSEGRVPPMRFTRELLRDEGRVVGAYDGTITSTDPFPDREPFAGADPTLTGIGVVYTAAVNHLLRTEIGVTTDREYKLLESEITLAWKNDEAFHYVQPTHGAGDDFRYGMAMSPHIKAFITHGWYDLMTPYYASDRTRNLMRLDDSVADRITVRHFGGGHMFYAWQESRRAFSEAIAEFVKDAISS